MCLDERKLGLGLLCGGIGLLLGVLLPGGFFLFLLAAALIVLGILLLTA